MLCAAGTAWSLGVPSADRRGPPDRLAADAPVGSLRWGELALRRTDVDLDARLVRVSRQLTEARGAPLAFGTPRTDAGKRIVAIPEVLIPELRWHLARFAAEGDEGLLFTSPGGRNAS